MPPCRASSRLRAPARRPPRRQRRASPAAPREEISEEILVVIAATVAAFLGERAHVRQVRLVASEAWAQQGRVSVHGLAPLGCSPVARAEPGSVRETEDHR